jgi:hypothetical protein
MAIPGHRSVKMNERYAHPSPEHLRAKFDAATKTTIDEEPAKARRTTKRALGQR